MNLDLKSGYLTYSFTFINGLTKALLYPFAVLQTFAAKPNISCKYIIDNIVLNYEDIIFIKRRNL